MDEQPAGAQVAAVVTPGPEAPAAILKPWESKTMWVSLATTVLPTLITVLNPVAGAALGTWVGANHQLVLAGLGALFAGLRMVSHGKVVVK